MSPEIVRLSVALQQVQTGDPWRVQAATRPHSASVGFKRWAGMAVHVCNPNTQEMEGIMSLEPLWTA